MTHIPNPRAMLDEARQSYLRTLVSAATAGIPAAELEADHQALLSARSQLLDLCHKPDGAAHDGAQ